MPTKIKRGKTMPTTIPTLDLPVVGTAVVVTVQASHIAGHSEEAWIEPNKMVPQSETATLVVQSDGSGAPLQRRGCGSIVVGAVVAVSVVVVVVVVAVVIVVVVVVVPVSVVVVVLVLVLVLVLLLLLVLVLDEVLVMVVVVVGGLLRLAASARQSKLLPHPEGPPQLFSQ